MGDAFLNSAPLMIAQARLEQSAIAAYILQEAARWLSERGIPLWQVSEITAERFRAPAERGELYLAWQGDRATGVMLLQEEDFLFWPDAVEGESLFLHKLAIRRSVAGRGVASALISWAVAETRRRNRRFLRLDCDNTRPSLHSFYQSHGFTLQGVRDMGSWQAALYQIDNVVGLFTRYDSELLNRVD